MLGVTLVKQTGVLPIRPEPHTSDHSILRLDLGGESEKSQDGPKDIFRPLARLESVHF